MLIKRAELPGVAIIVALVYVIGIPTILPQALMILIKLAMFVGAIVLAIALARNKQTQLAAMSGFVALVFNPLLLIVLNAEFHFLIQMMASLIFFGIALYLENSYKI